MGDDHVPDGRIVWSGQKGKGSVVVVTLVKLDCHDTVGSAWNDHFNQVVHGRSEQRLFYHGVGRSVCLPTPAPRTHHSRHGKRASKLFSVLGPRFEPDGVFKPTIPDRGVVQLAER